MHIITIIIQSISVKLTDYGKAIIYLSRGQVYVAVEATKTCKIYLSLGGRFDILPPKFYSAILIVTSSCGTVRGKCPASYFISQFQIIKIFFRIIFYLNIDWAIHYFDQS